MCTKMRWKGRVSGNFKIPSTLELSLISKDFPPCFRRARNVYPTQIYVRRNIHKYFIDSKSPLCIQRFPSHIDRLPSKHMHFPPSPMKAKSKKPFGNDRSTRSFELSNSRKIYRSYEKKGFKCARV